MTYTAIIENNRHVFPSLRRAEAYAEAMEIQGYEVAIQTDGE
jgi:hypothetical protein